MRARAHTHMRARARVRAHTRTRTHTHTHAHTHTRARARPHTYACTRAHTQLKEAIVKFKSGLQASLARLEAEKAEALADEDYVRAVFNQKPTRNDHANDVNIAICVYPITGQHQNKQKTTNRIRIRN